MNVTLALGALMLKVVTALAEQMSDEQILRAAERVKTFSLSEPLDSAERRFLEQAAETLREYPAQRAEEI